MLGEIVAGGVVCCLVGIIIKTQQTKINKLDEDKIDKELCGERTGNMMKTLDRIDHRVEKIFKSNGFE